MPNNLTKEDVEEIRAVVEEVCEPYFRKLQRHGEILEGNGNPEKGHVVRLASLEQTRGTQETAAKRHVWIVGAIIGGCATVAGGIGSAIITVVMG